MKYLILYYNLIEQKYYYRLFNEVESALNFRNKIHDSNLCRTSYVYRLYGRKSDYYEKM